MEDEEDERCCICGREATCCYAGREDCPSCGRAECELRMQRGIDYHEEAGDR